MEVRIAETKVRVAEAEVRVAEAEVRVVETEVRMAETEVRTAETKVRVAETEVRMAETEVRTTEMEVRMAKRRSGWLKGGPDGETEVRMAKTEVRVAGTEKAPHTGHLTADPAGHDPGRGPALGGGLEVVGRTTSVGEDHSSESGVFGRTRTSFTDSRFQCAK